MDPWLLVSPAAWETVRGRLGPWVRVSLRWNEDKSYLLRKFEEWTAPLVTEEADAWAQEMKCHSVDPIDVYHELGRQLDSLSLMPTPVKQRLRGRLHAATKGNRGRIPKHAELYRIAVQAGIGGLRKTLRSLPERRTKGSWPPP
jgi:hypothetical protein